MSLKDETEIWLNANKIPYNRLIMMPNVNDSEYIFKKDAVSKYIDLRYCCGIYDNNAKFINYMKSQNVRTTQIESESFEPVS